MIPEVKLRQNSLCQLTGFVLAAPFSTVGVDHAGPLYARDAGKTKFYILLFTCAVIRAVHLELIGPLSTQDTVLAFRRFVSCRGHPNIVYSDNSKTFIALSRHLSEKLFFFRPTWKFITPRVPWVGGWWEGLILSVKKGLRKTLGLRLITVVELTTVLTEIEHCINCRPLTYISDNPEYDVITPEGFLITKAAISSEQASKAHPYHALSQAQGTILEHFWQVWRNEYLTNLPSNLTNSHSHRNIEWGQVVLVREDFDKRIAWPMSVIVNVRESSDNIVRSATVKIGDKTYDRPIQRLYELKGWDQGQSTNELLHFIDTGTPSKTTDDLPSGNSETTAKQAEALADPIPSSSKEPTDVMGEETARTGDSGGSPAYHTRSGRRVKAIQRFNV